MDHTLTVEQLLKFIEKHNIPLTAKVRLQRIEDVYFENNGWTTTKKYQSDIGDCEYFSCFTAVKYPDDDNLYLDGHY